MRSSVFKIGHLLFVRWMRTLNVSCNRTNSIELTYIKQKHFLIHNKLFKMDQSALMERVGEGILQVAEMQVRADSATLDQW